MHNKTVYRVKQGCRSTYDLYVQIRHRKFFFFYKTEFKLIAKGVLKNELLELIHNCKQFDILIDN